MAEKNENISVEAYNQGLPYNLEAEQSVLGSVLIDPELLSSIMEKISTPQVFYTEQHRKIYSLIIRTSVIAKGNRQAEKLHNETTRLVRAQTQASIGRVIYDLLTTEEKKVYRRGRNSHPMHHAKGASLEEYLQATALETLCGYLYLQGRTERLMELLRTGLEMTQRRNGDPLL